MRKYLIFLLVPFFLGCTAPKLWYGNNTNRDLYECNIEAINKFAPAVYSMQIGSGYREPSFTTCSAYGWSALCNTTGGNYVPPTQVAMDANVGNREQYITYCMSSRGNVLMTKDEYDARRQTILAGNLPGGSSIAGGVGQRGLDDSFGAKWRKTMDDLINSYNGKEYESLNDVQKRVRFREMCSDTSSIGYSSNECRKFREIDSQTDGGSVGRRGFYNSFGEEWRKTMDDLIRSYNGKEYEFLNDFQKRVRFRDMCADTRSIGYSSRECQTFREIDK